MAVERLLRFPIVFLTTVLLVRFLDQETYGNWAYALTLFSIGGAISTLGIDSLLVRDVSRHRKDATTILSAALVLRLAAAAVVMALLMLFAVLEHRTDQDIFVFLVVFACGVSLQAADVYAAWFISEHSAHWVAGSRLLALLIGSLAKVVVVVAGLPLAFLAFASVIEIGGAALIVACVYFWRSRPRPRFNFQWITMMDLARQSLPLVAGALGVMIYIRIDSVMLEHMQGPRAVAIYSVASRLSEVWNTAPTVLITVASPILVRARQRSIRLYHFRFRQTLHLMAIMTLIGAATLAMTSGWWLPLIFGHDYTNSVLIFQVHVWSSVFVALGLASSNFLLIEGRLGLTAAYIWMGATTNLVLNFIMIPRYGPLGAAVATLVAQVIAAWLGNLVLTPTTRKLFRYQLEALLLVGVWSGRLWPSNKSART